ncbi:MAG: FeoB small GTPase domain-containing protein [Spirochaetota bacterium]
MKVLLVGNPNVGKSVIFNRLTGMDVISSNYPGTTVDYAHGHLKKDGEIHDIIDVPGMYSLKPENKTEEVALKMIQEGDVLINVLNATNLERSLNLTLQLIQLEKPLLLAINMMDDAKRKGISIDFEKIQTLLGVPCIPTSAITGQGIKPLTDRINDAVVSGYITNEENRWNETGKIIDQVQQIQHTKPSILEKFKEATIRPITGFPLLVAILLGSFSIIKHLGGSLKKMVFKPLFDEYWTPVMFKLSDWIGDNQLLHDLLIGQLIRDNIHYGQSFGLLTTGLFVPIGIVLPYVIIFFILLAILEDTGYIPRIAVMMDRLMHKAGLHGLSVIPLMLGLGCNVPGAMAIRILEDKKQKFIAMTLLAITIPCMSLQAMLFGILGPYGFKGLGIVFGTLLLTFFTLGFIMRKSIKGTSPEIFIEIPPYRLPYFKGLLKKIWMRLKWFLKEAVPFVLVGILIANLLYISGIMKYIGLASAPVLNNLFGLPNEAASALVMGFLRKDLAMGMLLPLNLSFQQLVVASVVLSMYFPCVATFAVIIKEMGWKDMLKSTAIMLITALIAGTVVNMLFNLF